MRCKKIILSILLVMLAVNVFSKTVYISPNNDGVNDALSIPLAITDSRYVKEWAIIIENDQGQVVRTIGNKVAFPEKITFKGFWKRLFEEEKGVEIPETVTWYGTMDSGEIAPDGKYFYYAKAVDDNGNTALTKKYTVVVDNSPPLAEITQPSVSAKIFGGDNKPVIDITQTGSVEDKWEGVIVDTSDNIVKTFTWYNTEPKNFTWNGKDQNDVAVTEGVYAYRLTATDKAGNTNEPAQILNIEYDAIPRSVNMMVQGSPFSPGTSSEKAAITIMPTISTDIGLEKWSIDVIDFMGNSVYQFLGQDSKPAEKILYDGKGFNGNILTDGLYKLVFTASFDNGQVSVINRNITVDTTKPVAVVRADKTIFSPNGDGKFETITFYQEGSKEKDWSARIENEAGEVVRNWVFGEMPPSSLEWKGLTNDGEIIDGKYTYILSTTDLAGNEGIASTIPFDLDTGTTEVFVTVNRDAFSPNGDSINDTVSFTPVVRTSTEIIEYDLRVLDDDKNIVKTFSANSKLPKNITWNGLTDEGLRAGDGIYTASLYAVSKNGSETTATTQSFILDSVYPKVSVSLPYTLFSPNGDSKRDSVPINISSSDEDLWTANIVAEKTGELVKSYTWNGEVNSFEWDGSDEAGNIIADGSYVFKIFSTDIAGNKIEAQVGDIVVDTRLATAYVAVEYDAFSPNGDEYLDTQTFTLNTSLSDGLKDWSFEIIDSLTQKTIRSWDTDDQANVPKTILWDGTDVAGAIAEGKMQATLKVAYNKGDEIEATSAPFISSATSPRLSVQVAPEYFSPDNDGVDDDLFIKLKGNSVVPFKSWSFDILNPSGNGAFWSAKGKSSIAEKIIWDGRGNNGELVQSATDYPYVFTVTDTLGMTSTVEGIIPIDVLVIRIGDVLKMQVPSIIFRSDNADFIGQDEDPKQGLDLSVIEKNETVLKRIASILAKFNNYNVTIEGHANNLSGTEAEETSTANGNIPLVPLSEDRAQFVMDKLIGYGINENRLSIVGQGGRVPVAARDDRDNWWKNRRVEFILEK